MKKFKMMKSQGIYKLVERLADVNIIRLKWVYIPKFNGDGGLVDRKARIVA